jgi:beta-glucosidase
MKANLVMQSSLRGGFFSMLLTAALFLTISGDSQTISADSSRRIDRRVEEMLKQMTLEEKVYQLQSQLLFLDKYKDRNYAVGHFRNIAHFMHKNRALTAGTCAAAINEDTRQSILASRLGIPVLQHGEALHGAQWGMATVFPQCIGLAATFDDSLVFHVGEVVARELRAVGVREVYAPVINIARDPRWGRMQETYGEDVI